MKQFFAFILIVLSFVGAPTTFVSAQTTKPSEKTEPESLLVRKQKAETEFKNTIAQLSLLITRTQSALAVLADKDIDVADGQEELDLATKSLLEAKSALGTFSKVTVVEGKQDKAQQELKSTAKKLEEALRTSREHLINALSTLKGAVATDAKSAN